MSAASPEREEKQETSRQAPRLMFDPSSLLDRGAFGELTNLARQVDTAQPIFVAASFVRALNEPDLIPSVQRYFGRRVEQATSQDVLAMIRQARLESYTWQPAPGRADGEIVERLMRQRDRIIRDILLEEWSFLTEQSWIAARSKKTFNTFRRAGAIVVDFSGRKFDDVVVHTLRRNRLPTPAPLTNRDRLKAAAKWIAAGGTPIVGLLDPMFGAAVSVSTAVFFLFDP